MEKTLVVGATGQLGMAAVRVLLRKGRSVRALVRRPESVERFRAMGVEAAVGDLLFADSLRPACEGITSVIATANSAMPQSAMDTAERVEGEGYANLVRAARAQGVNKIVFSSALMTRFEPRLFRMKRRAEEVIAGSGLEHVILRADAFMDVAFAMMGSTVPVRGAENPTVGREFGFAKNHFAKIGQSIERDGVALVPGDGTVRHAFICVDDVAEFLVAGLREGLEGVHDAAGPQALTYAEVAKLFEKFVGRPLRLKKTPAWVFRMMAFLMGLRSPAAANLMEINYVSATEESLPKPETAARFGVRLTTAEEFLRARWLRGA